MSNRILLILSFCFFWHLSKGQNVYDFKFKNYSVKEGLVHNKVNQILMDDYGFLWVATEGGLSRFDGVEFKNFNSFSEEKTAFPSYKLNDIKLRKDGVLWIASSAGIFTLNTKNFQVNRFKQLKISSEINALALDSVNNCTWFVNEETQNLCKIDWKTENLDSFTSQKVRDCKDIIYRNNKIYMAISRQGILEFNIKNKKFKEHQKYIWPVCFKIMDGEFWTSCWQNDLFKYDENLDSFVRHKLTTELEHEYYQYIVFGLEKLNDSHLILGLNSGDGLAIYDYRKQKVVQKIKKDYLNKNSVQSNFIEKIYKDPFGNIWIASWDGLIFLNLKDQEFRSKQFAFLDTRLYNLMNGIVRDKKQKNILWMSANGSGIVKFNEQNSQAEKHFFKETFHETDPNYNYRWTEFLDIDDNNCVWSGGYTGLVKIENDVPKTYDFFKETGYCFVNNLYRESDTVFWVSSYQKGLIKFNPKNGKYMNYTPKNSEILSRCVLNVIPKKNGDLIIVTNKGVQRFSPKEKWFKTIDIGFDAKKDDITCMVIDKNEDIYFSTINAVYHFANITKKLEKINFNGYISPNIRTPLIIDSLNDLWIYSINGLFRYQSVSKNIDRFNQKDGIYNITSDASRLFQFEDNIYLGFRSAYTMFNPNKIALDRGAAKPYITGIQLSNKNWLYPFSLKKNKAISISYKDNIIDFYFTAIQYTQAEKTVFYYQLEGFDKGWQYAGTNRKITYTNLDGGKYTFKVKAISANKIESISYDYVKITIIPPFWKTWWFLTLTIILFLVLIWLIYQYRVNEIKKKEKLKTAYNKKIAELESKALRSQMNPHFVFNSLNSIQNFIVKNDIVSSSNYLNKFARLTRLIFDHSQQQFITIEQELNAIKTYLEIEQLRFTNKFDYSITIDPNIDMQSMEIPPMIIQPFIENAIWHGIMHQESIKGNISIEIKKQVNFIEISIEDNGIGRKASMDLKSKNGSEHQSSGMRLTKDRLNILNKENNFEIETEIIDLYEEGNKAKGTKIIIKIPF